MPGEHLFDDERPNAFGAFRVLGARPSGSAYLALDPSTNANVVVHTIEVRGHWRHKEAAVTHSLRALCSANTRHQHVARPLASGIEAGTPYIVYAHAPGITIDALVQQSGAQPLGEIVRCLMPVASAVDLAASAGMHHGALTPADIVVDDEDVSVTSFGLVDALRHVGLDIAVQDAYSSPQRRDGAPPTLADDVYSLAAVAQQMLGGVAPVGVDAQVLRVAMSRALSESPSTRQPRATDFVDELRRAFVQQDTNVADGLMSFVSERSESPSRVLVPFARGSASVSPSLLMSDAVPVVPAGKGRRNILLVTVVLASFAAAFTGRLLFGTQGDPAPPAPATNDATPATPDVPPATPDVSPAAPRVPPQLPPQDSQPPASTLSPPSPASPPEAPRSTSSTAPASQRNTSETSSRPVVPDKNAPGALLVSTYPQGAQLFVDDALVGTTPLLLPGLAVGSHQVRIELSGFQTQSRSIQIEPNKRFRLAIKMER